jgi:hypothetical protein
MAIQFTAETHKYESLDQGKKIDWLSVTSLVGLFKPPFEKEKIATKASKNPKSKWHGLTPQEIMDIWGSETDRAINLGSWYHDQREQEVIMCETLQRSGIDLPIIRPIEQDGIKLAPDQNLTPGIYPEHLAYLKSAGVCGQADRVEVIQEVIDLYDYKTNKEIKMKGFTNWEGKTERMLGVCSHLDHCNFNHYALQLSTYMYMMQKHNHNLKAGKIQIHHIKFEVESYDQYGYPITAMDAAGEPIVKEVIPYDLPYLKKEVRNMINYVKQNPEVIKNGKV